MGGGGGEVVEAMGEEEKEMGEEREREKWCREK